MGKWQLLDYPQERTTTDVAGAAMRHLLAGKPAYLLHDQVVFTLTMETGALPDGTRERVLVLEPSAGLGELGHEDLRRLKERGPFRSTAIRLPAFPDAAAADQVAGLLTERAGQAFLDQLHDEFHK